MLREYPVDEQCDENYAGGINFYNTEAKPAGQLGLIHPGYYSMFDNKVKEFKFSITHKTAKKYMPELLEEMRKQNKS